MATRILMHSWRRFAVAGLSLWVACAALPAPAQTVTPTQEQLDLLEGLSDDERQALMQQFGIGTQDGGTRADERRDGVTAGEQRNRDVLRSIRLKRAIEEEEERRLKADDTIIIQIGFPRSSDAPQPIEVPSTIPGAPPATVVAQPLPRFDSGEPPLTAEQRERLTDLILQVRAKNPYRLDRNGMLFLPGFGAGGIAFAGLDEKQATLRLQTEPAFARLEVEVVKLRLQKPGPDGLVRFGYELFEEESASTFAPITEVPVPADYVVGPGDELQVQLYGNQNRNLKLTVGGDGNIRFPELGPIRVGGRRFSAVQSSIESRVARQMIGVRASVAMGEPRAIRIFVLGDVKRPGTYTVSGLATMTTALYASGGVHEVGSLRNIQLKRQGELVRSLDLYDLLIQGDTSDDAKLLPGDVIFIPPVGKTFAIDGEVRRPAMYELRDESSIVDLVELAGGLTAEADPSRASLTRIDPAGRRSVVSVRLDGSATETATNGGALRILRLRPQVDAGVTLAGHVYRPGAYAYRQGMRLTDVIGSIDELRPNGDSRYVLIRREQPPNRRITSVSADLAAALSAPGSEADVELMPRDEIMVFDLEAGRTRALDPLLDELRLHSTLEHPTQIVQIEGRVRAPGEYPLEPGMRVTDLLRAGGSLGDAAYGGRAELTRYRVVNGEQRQTELVEIDLAAALRGDIAADLELQPFDYLSIKELPEWGQEEKVTLRGEVRFPGIYPIRRGETLQSVLARAGGLTEQAFAEGAVFARIELKRREQEQLDRLGERLKKDLASLALQGAAANQGNAAATIQVGQALLTQLESAAAVGRLVIDLPRVLEARRGSPDDVVLRGGDELLVPRTQQEVTVIGEVQSATSHLWRPELGRDGYISLSGGTTRKADRGKIYVVRANGGVVAAESTRWFSRGGNVRMRPGDTVVVPLDTDRLPALPFWQAVVSIVYNAAIAAAAVNSF
jgi:polysaccharide biosynthesis/export protein